jgi:hypothetical protein
MFSLFVGGLFILLWLLDPVIFWGTASMSDFLSNLLEYIQYSAKHYEETNFGEFLEYKDFKKFIEESRNELLGNPVIRGEEVAELVDQATKTEKYERWLKRKKVHDEKIWWLRLYITIVLKIWCDIVITLWYFWDIRVHEEAGAKKIWEWMKSEEGLKKWWERLKGPELWKMLWEKSKRDEVWQKLLEWLRRMNGQ